LTAESDSDYLTSIEKDLKAKIFSLLKKYENQMSYIDFCKLTQICEDTFKGKPFEDVELNAFNNKLITRALEQLN
jgi:hypothetical protein